MAGNKDVLDNATSNLCQYLNSVRNIANFRNSTSNSALHQTLTASLDECDKEIDSMVLSTFQTLIKRIHTIKQSFRSIELSGPELAQFRSDERNLFSCLGSEHDIDYAKQEREQAERNRVITARLEAEYEAKFKAKADEAAQKAKADADAEEADDSETEEYDSDGIRVGTYCPPFIRDKIRGKKEKSIRFREKLRQDREAKQELKLAEEAKSSAVLQPESKPE